VAAGRSVVTSRRTVLQVRERPNSPHTCAPFLSRCLWRRPGGIEWLNIKWLRRDSGVATLPLPHRTASQSRKELVSDFVLGRTLHSKGRARESSGVGVPRRSRAVETRKVSQRTAVDRGKRNHRRTLDRAGGRDAEKATSIGSAKRNISLLNPPGWITGPLALGLLRSAFPIDRPLCAPPSSRPCFGRKRRKTFSTRDLIDLTGGSAVTVRHGAAVAGREDLASPIEGSHQKGRGLPSTGSMADAWSGLSVGCLQACLRPSRADPVRLPSATLPPARPSTAKERDERAAAEGRDGRC